MFGFTQYSFIPGNAAPYKISRSYGDPICVEASEEALENKFPEVPSEDLPKCPEPACGRTLIHKESDAWYRCRIHGAQLSAMRGRKDRKEIRDSEASGLILNVTILPSGEVVRE